MFTSVLRASALTGFALAISISLPAQATWSVVVLDKATRTIGIAGASCSHIVYGIGEMVPGKGAVIAQAASNRAARDKALAMVKLGVSETDIIKKITDPAFDADFAEQQYAVLTFDEFDTPLTFSGKHIPAYAGTLTAPGISVQGNTLTGPAVLKAAFDAATGTGAMPARLMAALADAAKVGGDVRCGDQKATSAFITVMNADDVIPARFLNLVIYGLDKGSVNAVDKLGEIYRRWAAGPAQAHTRVVCHQKVEGEPDSYFCE